MTVDLKTMKLQYETQRGAYQTVLASLPAPPKNTPAKPIDITSLLDRLNTSVAERVLGFRNDASRTELEVKKSVLSTQMENMKSQFDGFRKGQLELIKKAHAQWKQAQEYGERVAEKFKADYAEAQGLVREYDALLADLDARTIDDAELDRDIRHVQGQIVAAEEANRNVIMVEQRARIQSEIHRLNGMIEEIDDTILGSTSPANRKKGTPHAKEVKKVDRGAAKNNRGKRSPKRSGKGVRQPEPPLPEDAPGN